MSTEKYGVEIENSIRRNIGWDELPGHLHKILYGNRHDYEKYVFNYSLKNQLRYRGNIVSKVFRSEQRYYELLIQKNVHNLNLFPYHLADVVTRGLRVTPFNYYLEVISQLLRNDKSYDTLPNFTAADCLRVLGIGRNEYLSLISEMKTRSLRLLIFNTKLNPIDILPRFPAPINIEPWWYVEIAHVLETDIRYVSGAERQLLDYLIDYGPIEAGKCNYEVVHALYRKGFIYLDVAIAGKERISIPPLRNFVMNRISGDYFENLLYKIFISVDEHMTLHELAQMLQLDFDIVKQAVALFCRLGFAQLKDTSHDYDSSWSEVIEKRLNSQPMIMPITPLTFNSLNTDNTENSAINDKEKDKSLTPTPIALDNCSVSNTSSSDGNTSDYSFANVQSLSNLSTTNETNTPDHHYVEHEVSSEIEDVSLTPNKQTIRTTTTVLSNNCNNKRIGVIFDSTLAAFLMMGNLSPGLKNHAVTMFEVGKLCDESMKTFLTELEKVSLLDAEGEGDVSRYFTHAVILRSTICSLRYVVDGGLDLLRLECLEALDRQTRDRVLEKKYKFLISCSPLTAKLTHLFRLPFFGQYYRSSDCCHMWTKLFYYQLTGYGPPSLLLTRGTVLKMLPKMFLGYGKLLINILHSDCFVISSENYRCLNDQLQNGCVLVQGYGIRTPGDLHYEPFPFTVSAMSGHNDNDKHDSSIKWTQHRGIQRLSQFLDLTSNCGYITFLNSGVPDMGSHTYNEPINYRRNSHKKQLKTKTTNIPSKENIEENDNIFSDDNATISSATSPLEEEISNFTLIDLVELNNDHNNDTHSKESNHHNNNNNNNDNNYNDVDSLQVELADVHHDHFAVSPEKRKNIKAIAGSHNDNDNDVAADQLVEEWTLLDVNFGVPLFDIACNTYICEQIAKKLCQPDNLVQLTQSAATMNSAFLSFVRQCMMMSEHDELDFALEDSLPQPCFSLAFENGHVFHWNGK